MDIDRVRKQLNLGSVFSVRDVDRNYETRRKEVQREIDIATNEVDRQKNLRVLEGLQQCRQIAYDYLRALENLPSDQPSIVHADQLETTILDAGTLLNNRYRIVRFIGSGGMGTVYEAYDEEQKVNIAVKVVTQSYLESNGDLEKFFEEADIARTLNHPNIVRVFNAYQENGLAFFTMELLSGQNLRERLANPNAQFRHITTGEAIEIIKDIGAALVYANKKIVHRDIKPENIWLADDGKAKLMDFGVAQLLEAAHRTTGNLIGTPDYAAPEQRVDGLVDARADQYSLAAVLFEMLTGRPPVGRVDSLSEITVPIAKAVDRALSTDPVQRFTTIEEFLDALDADESFANKPLIAIVVATVLLASIVFGYMLSNLTDDSTHSERGDELAELSSEALFLFGTATQYLQDIEAREAQMREDLVRLRAEKSKISTISISKDLNQAGKNFFSDIELWEENLSAQLAILDKPKHHFLEASGKVQSTALLLEQQRYADVIATLETVLPALRNRLELLDTLPLISDRATKIQQQLIESLTHTTKISHPDLRTSIYRLSNDLRIELREVTSVSGSNLGESLASLQQIEQITSTVLSMLKTIAASQVEINTYREELAEIVLALETRPFASTDIQVSFQRLQSSIDFSKEQKTKIFHEQLKNRLLGLWRGRVVKSGIESGSAYDTELVLSLEVTETVGPINLVVQSYERDRRFNQRQRIGSSAYTMRIQTILNQKVLQLTGERYECTEICWGTPNFSTKLELNTHSIRIQMSDTEQNLTKVH